MKYERESIYFLHTNDERDGMDIGAWADQKNSLIFNGKCSRMQWSQSVSLFQKREMLPGSKSENSLSKSLGGGQFLRPCVVVLPKSSHRLFIAGKTVTNLTFISQADGAISLCDVI